MSLGQSLPSPIVTGASATFGFVEIALGEDHLMTNYSTSAALEMTGVDSPYMKIPVGGVSITAIDSTTGVATFDVTMECRVPTVSTNSECPSANNVNQAMAGMKLKLVQDTYTNALTLAQAQTIMASGTVTVANGDLSVVPANGGYKTSVVGPGQLVANKNMILIVEYLDSVSSNSSYRYFNVDIGDSN